MCSILLHNQGMSITVRKAVKDDVDFLLSQLDVFSDFYGTKKRLFPNEDYAREKLTELIKGQVVFIAEKQGVGSIGFIAGILFNHPFNPDIRVLSETFWWVQEEHRNSRAGLMLLNEFTEFGKETADWVTTAIEEKSPINDRVLLKRGYKATEKNFLLEVN